MTLPDPARYFSAGSARLAHIRKVVETAQAIETRLPFDGRLVAAACYHDIGYADALNVTGYHPVDGAELARRDGLEAEVIDAVLHHSGARALAERSRPDLMGYYGPTCRMMQTPVSRALTFCDTHSGPQGQWFSLDQRLAEIRQRHAGNAALLAVLDLHLADFRALAAEFLPVLG